MLNNTLLLAAGGKAGVAKPAITKFESAFDKFYMPNIDVASTPFKAYGGSDTHKASDWKFCSDTTGTKVINSWLNSTTSLTSLNESVCGAGNGQTGYFFVRHIGERYGPSPWSEPYKGKILTDDQYC